MQVKSTRFRIVVPVVILLLPITYFLVDRFIGRESPATPWVREGLHLMELGIVLRAYREDHSQQMPESIQALKKWSEAQGEFRSLSEKAEIWSFRDPVTKELDDWLLGGPLHPYLIAAPRSRPSEKGLPERRLILNDDHKPRYLPEVEIGANEQ